MTSIRTWLTHWRGRSSIARWWVGDPNAPPFPPDIMAKIDATVEKLEVTFTERTVAQIQAELRAAAAEDRLADYTAAWLQGSVEQLSTDLLRERRGHRSSADPGQAGSSGAPTHVGCR